jgi:transcriptional regulator with XRE-family HTH domain
VISTKKDVARTMKRLRGGRTQAACARKAGINANAWSHYEQAQRMPSEENFAKIAIGLGVTLTKLEEEVLESRELRLREDEQAKAAPAASPPRPVADPFRQAVQEGVQKITHELERLFLLVGDAKNFRL